ncbi:aromatic amino acid transaminase [Tsukamurella sp. 8F]|uniref:aromatic amino acid transaminase n=1 Tax=unclassified Tsukamurella TaxID=2633480 RepID=UPI0023B9EF06|nr:MULTISPECIES: aromatic amino acid transaminase [unclassified Tsukamurella]MDF0532343.1 aromatic amino acid transaminase [Tsukamurella sp. 8J]MDF0589461.1 aromatic amino acid transaminase [Tsukamurella sp. 8F]
MPSLQLDPLWRLSEAWAADTRPDPLNLVIGVYRDEQGVCPVQRAVSIAEARLAERAPSKEYTSPAGNLEFNAGICDLILGDPALIGRATSIQAVGGTGALRLISDLLAVTGPGRTVHLGTPAYVNHPAVLRAAGLRVSEYPLEQDGRLDAAAALDVARTAAPGDVLLLQGCCHNPTGLGMPLETWIELAHIMAERGVVPFIDQAYFGLGDGVDEDLEGMRAMLEIVPEAAIAVSASKAWGLYSERTGCAIVLSSNPARGEYVRGVLEVVARAAYSQAPSHGARVVAEILGDETLRADWRVELEEMRQRLTLLRAELVAELLATTTVPALPQLGQQRGMFLRLPLDADQMERLRIDHAIYGVPSGRINLAGLTSDRIPRVAAAIGEVVASSPSRTLL